MFSANAFGGYRETTQPTPSAITFSPELVRTVAIVLVIIVHASSFPYIINDPVTSTAQFNWWTVNVYGAIGYLGVPLFVILSGVLLLDPAKADESLTVFFKKRFARIGIPMIFWTLIYFGWAYFRGNQMTPENTVGALLSGSYGPHRAG